MTIVLEILAVLLVVALFVGAFLRSSPATLAATLRIAGPLLLGLGGIGFVALGRAGLGSGMVAAALAWAAVVHLSRKKPKPKPHRSMVRTAALEMELDHETGALEGLVLAGRREGQLL